MKRLLAALLLLSTPALALEPNIVNRSSHTATNETAYIPAAYLDKVIVPIATASGVLEIYSSTYTTTISTNNVLVASITLATVGTYDFDDTQVKGIYYKTSTATNGVTIIFKR
jgi:hypothetical protein